MEGVAVGRAGAVTYSARPAGGQVGGAIGELALEHAVAIAAVGERGGRLQRHAGGSMRRRAIKVAQEGRDRLDVLTSERQSN